MEEGKSVGVGVGALAGRWIGACVTTGANNSRSLPPLQVVLQKTRRKLRVVMDGSVVNKEKMRKRNRFGSKLFIGSLPRTLASGSDIAVS